MRRAWLWLIALLSLVVSGLGYTLGAIAGLFIAGLVAGYTWGHGVVSIPPPSLVENDDE